MCKRLLGWAVFRFRRQQQPDRRRVVRVVGHDFDHHLAGRRVSLREILREFFPTQPARWWSSIATRDDRRDTKHCQDQHSRRNRLPRAPSRTFARQPNTRKRNRQKQKHARDDRSWTTARNPRQQRSVSTETRGQRRVRTSAIDGRTQLLKIRLRDLQSRLPNFPIRHDLEPSPQHDFRLLIRCRLRPGDVGINLNYGNCTYSKQTSEEKQRFHIESPWQVCIEPLTGPQKPSRVSVGGIV